MIRRVPMAAILTVVLLCSASLSAEKARSWRIGRLMSANTQDWTSSSTSPVRCSNAGDQTNCSGGQTMDWNHETYKLVIMAGKKTYFAVRTLSFRWQHSPRLTENAPVRFAVEGDTFILLDDTGREFKMGIEKQRNNGPKEVLEECRTSMIEIHQQNIDMAKLDLWLAGLPADELWASYLYNISCLSESLELGDLALGSQFASVRLEMLAARAGKDAPISSWAKGLDSSAEECGLLTSNIEKAAVGKMSAAEISESTGHLYACAMSRFRRDQDKWFLLTTKSIDTLLLPVIDRQTTARRQEEMREEETQD